VPGYFGRQGAILPDETDPIFLPQSEAASHPEFGGINPAPFGIVLARPFLHHVKRFYAGTCSPKR
jgi:hypothetical protein